MGYDVYYHCTKVQVLEDLGLDKEDGRVLFCEIQCENEHGHDLAPDNAVVVFYGDENGSRAKIEGYLENILAEDLPEDEYEAKCEKLMPYLEDTPSYHIYDEFEFGKMIVKALAGRKLAGEKS